MGMGTWGDISFSLKNISSIASTCGTKNMWSEAFSLSLTLQNFASL